MIKNDRQIAVLAQSGDPSAFELLVKQYERMIWHHCYRLVNSREDAEDLTQEIFVKAYRSIKSYCQDYSFKQWLYTIATRTAYDFLRKRRRRPIVWLEDPDSIVGMNGSTSQSASEDYRWLDRALSQLRPIQRKAIGLYYFHALSYSEIAAELIIPINSVKTHLYRGKQSLRSILEHDYGIFSA